MNIYSFLQTNSHSHPNNAAINDAFGTMTYAQLNDAVVNIANKLIEFNIKPNQGVGVMGSNSRDFIVMSFAVMKIGAVLMPIAPNLSSGELHELIVKSGLHFVCFEKEHTGYENTSKFSDIIYLKTEWLIWKNQNANFKNKFCHHVNDAAFIRYTSGTTGSSKGVILSNKTIEERTRVANNVLKLNSSDKVLWVLSMAFHFVVSIILYIRYGCSIIINNSFLSGSIIESANLHHATFLYASPLHIRLLSQDKTETKMHSVKRVISTSSGITAEQCEAFYNRFHLPVSQAYGIIEVGLPIINISASAEMPGAIGKAVPEMDVKILDDKGNELPYGQSGNLAVNGPGVFDAYLSPPLSRDEIMQHGYFYTGDLAVCNANGIFSIIGRKKSMINVGGNKVFPEEVEAVLMKMDVIQNCRVSGFLHPLSGECVLAEIILQSNSLQPETEELYQFCKTHLSSYKVPQKFIFVDELPMTKSGKIKRSEL